MNMLAFYLLLVGLAGTFASPVLLDEQSIEEKIEEGIEERIEERIVGGRNGRIEEVPWQVSVMMNGHHRCGGTIISQFWVVSAAHCYSNVVSRYTIRAGATWRTSGGFIYQLSRYMNHPSFGRPTALSNDISLLQVRTAFRWSNQVSPISLPTQNQAVSAGTRGRISGWGTLWSGGPLADTLQIADVPIVSQAACRNAHGASFVTNDMLCTGFPQGGVATCQGDSGGPLIISGRLFGVTSWSRGCAQARFPGVFASVPFFRNWIRQQTGV